MALDLFYSYPYIDMWIFSRNELELWVIILTATRYYKVMKNIPEVFRVNERSTCLPTTIYNCENVGVSTGQCCTWLRLQRLFHCSWGLRRPCPLSLCHEWTKSRMCRITDRGLSTRTLSEELLCERCNIFHERTYGIKLMNKSSYFINQMGLRWI